MPEVKKLTRQSAPGFPLQPKPGELPIYHVQLDNTTDAPPYPALPSAATGPAFVVDGSGQRLPLPIIEHHSAGGAQAEVVEKAVGHTRH